MVEYDKKYSPQMVVKPEAGSIEEMILREKVKEYVSRKRNIMANVNNIFAIIWGQCTDSLQSVIQLHPEFEEKLSTLDGVWLMARIKDNIAGLSVRKKMRGIKRKSVTVCINKTVRGRKSSRLHGAI